MINMMIDGLTLIKTRILLGLGSGLHVGTLSLFY